MFPPLWIVGFGVGALTELRHKEDTFIFLMWLLGTIFLLLTWGRLKKVTLSPLTSKLYISNFLREIEVSFDDVEKISEIIMAPGIIKIRFRTKTRFGRSILFIPKCRSTIVDLKRSVFGDYKNKHNRPEER
jgi:hypothetical protein